MKTTTAHSAFSQCCDFCPQYCLPMRVNKVAVSDPTRIHHSLDVSYSPVVFVTARVPASEASYHQNVLSKARLTANASAYRYPVTGS